MFSSFLLWKVPVRILWVEAMLPHFLSPKPVDFQHSAVVNFPASAVPLRAIRLYNSLLGPDAGEIKVPLRSNNP